MTVYRRVDYFRTVTVLFIFCTRGSVSGSTFPNTEKRVENTTHSFFFFFLEGGSWISNETRLECLKYIFSIETDKYNEQIKSLTNVMVIVSFVLFFVSFSSFFFNELLLSLRLCSETKTSE